MRKGPQRDCHLSSHLSIQRKALDTYTAKIILIHNRKLALFSIKCPLKVKIDVKKPVIDV